MPSLEVCAEVTKMYPPPNMFYDYLITSLPPVARQRGPPSFYNAARQEGGVMCVSTSVTRAPPSPSTSVKSQHSISRGSASRSANGPSALQEHLNETDYQGSCAHAGTLTVMWLSGVRSKAEFTGTNHEDICRDFWENPNKAICK